MQTNDKRKSKAVYAQSFSSQHKSEGKTCRSKGGFLKALSVKSNQVKPKPLS